MRGFSKSTNMSNLRSFGEETIDLKLYAWIVEKIWWIVRWNIVFTLVSGGILLGGHFLIPFIVGLGRRESCECGILYIQYTMIDEV